MISKELEEFIKDETKAFEERLRAKAEELQEQVNNNVKSKTIWDLDIKDGERYYRPALDGDVTQGIFNTEYDKNVRAWGNAFLTEEEAEFEAERRKIEAIMRGYSRPFEWGENNYYIEYVHSTPHIGIDYLSTYNFGIPYFKSKEIAQKVINGIGEDKLKKYWFGIKDE